VQAAIHALISVRMGCMSRARKLLRRMHVSNSAADVQKYARPRQLPIMETTEPTISNALNGTRTASSAAASQNAYNNGVTSWQIKAF
jgi:hypothetical protein